MEKNIYLVATNIRPYGKGWQVNAFVDGIESEATYYHTNKEEALRKARQVIAQAGRLPHEPYKHDNALFSEAKRRKVLEGLGVSA